MILTIQHDRDEDGSTCEAIHFEGDVVDLAAAAAVLMANASEDVAYAAARFAQKAEEVLVGEDDE